MAAHTMTPWEKLPSPLGHFHSSSGSEPGRTPGACEELSYLREAEATLLPGKGRVSSISGGSSQSPRSSRDLQPGGGRKPQRPPWAPCKVLHIMTRTAAGAGEPGVCSPARVTIGLAEGTGTGAVQARCSALSTEAPHTQGVPEAAAVPAPPAFVSSGAHGKWESAPHSSQPLRKRRGIGSVEHAPPATPRPAPGAR